MTRSIDNWTLEGPDGNGGSTLYTMQSGWFVDTLRGPFDGVPYYLFSPDGKTTVAPGTRGFTVASNLPELLFIRDDGSGPTYDSTQRPAGYGGDNITLEISASQALLRGLPNHPILSDVQALDQTLSNEIEALYWEGSEQSDTFSITSRNDTARLRTIHFAGIGGDDKVILQGNLRPLDGTYNGTSANAPHSFAGGPGNDELFLDVSSQGSFQLEFLRERVSFGNSPVERIQTRFRIAGANGFQFDAVDVETISFFDASFERDNVYLAAPNRDTSLEGTDASEYFSFTSGDNEAKPGDGDDVVIDGPGDLELTGGSGAGNDFYNGGGGRDTLRYPSARAAITVDLSRGIARATAGDDSAGIGVDTLRNFEDVLGGRFNDTLVGNSRSNALWGAAGNDLLIGGAGSDQLRGGSGRDTFRYRNLGESRLAAMDRIRDLAIGIDQIDAATAVRRTNVRQLGQASALTQQAISATLAPAVFRAQQAATFSVGSRAFLALNDGTAGFNSRRDALIEITGFTGNLANLAIL